MKRSQENVYAAILPGYGVKIGRSVDPASRITHLRYSHGDDVALAYVLPCGNSSRVEVRAHAILKCKRIYGEWFDVGVEEAKIAIHQAHVEFILDDTPDIIRCGIFKKKVDRGIGQSWEGVGLQKPPASTIRRIPHRFTAESAKNYREQAAARRAALLTAKETA